MRERLLTRVTPTARPSLVRTSLPHHGDGCDDHMNGPHR